MRSKLISRSLAALLSTLLCSCLLFAQQKSASMPMGFDPAKAVHHFWLLKNGGAIELTSKDTNDAAFIKTLQQHLQLQAKNFEKGNYETQMQVHGKVPTGADTMKRLRNEITFDVKQQENGATLRMFSMNPQAREAIHEFLKFQIAEHQTGDPTDLDQ